jgi:hypothetical protein
MPGLPPERTSQITPLLPKGTIVPNRVITTPAPMPKRVAIPQLNPVANTTQTTDDGSGTTGPVSVSPVAVAPVVIPSQVPPVLQYNGAPVAVATSSSFDLSQIPLWGWAVGAVAAYFLFFKGGR